MKKLILSLCAILFALLCVLGPSRSQAGLGSHFLVGTGDAFTDSNKWIWLGGSVATLVAFKYDQDVYRYYAKKEKEEFPDSVGDIMGTGAPGAAIALLTLGAGWALGGDRALGAGQSHAEALFATFAYTGLLKMIIERDRPPAFSQKESSFNASFPSAHTSTSFATAGSMMASAGPILGVPFLALAGLTGYSRVQQRAHYLGDVLFGATLGYTMGTGFYKHHAGGRSTAWQIRPYFDDRDSWGVAINSNF